MGFNYSFSAVKGIQANREYYIAMVPLSLLSKLFRNEDEYVLPDYRAQRCVNEARIPEIRDYIINNRDTYVFSALSASIDGEFSFIKSELDDNLGVLQIDMNAIFIINDGQHRKAAIEAALKEDPKLGDETIAIVFFKDNGLQRSQQMFADLNKYAVKPSKSLSTLYDDRDGLSNAVKEVVQKIPFLDKYVDKEKDSLAKFSSKLFTLSNFLRANQRIIHDKIITDKDRDFLLDYWRNIFTVVDEWDELETKQLCKRSLKEEYVLTLSVIMNAFGRLGKYMYEHPDEMNKLRYLNNVDWLRENKEWIGRIISDQGKIVNNESAIIKACNLIKKKLGIKLSKEEKGKEDEISR